jgi:UDP-glucose 4-epimerase
MSQRLAKTRSVLVTGATGYIGGLAIKALAADRRGLERIVALDIREPADPVEGVEYLTGDIRDAGLAEILRACRVDCLIHLAAVVNPGPNPDRAFLHSVEVAGTENILQCCLTAGVGHFIITSSGAAYGYHADNPTWLDENDAIRGNAAFAYSDHKRQVEQMLARWRSQHPEIRQLVLRPGTILGAGVKNQITDLFDRKKILGLKGHATPFVFIWDEDVAAIIVKGVHEQAAGIYNLAGDGTLTLEEMAAMMGKPYKPLPVWFIKGVLWLKKKAGVTPYGPEQVQFLQYRPVLANRRLKEAFGYTPRKSTREVFSYFRAHRGDRHA